MLRKLVLPESTKGTTAVLTNQSVARPLAGVLGEQKSRPAVHEVCHKRPSGKPGSHTRDRYLWNCVAAILVYAVAKRFVHFSAHLQSIQQDGLLPSQCHHRSFVRILAATLRQAQSPTPQITVELHKGSECGVHFASSEFSDRGLLPC